MRILATRRLSLDGVHVLQFGRFLDARGYFCEPFRRSVLDAHPETGFLKDVRFPQQNESYSHAGTVRGLHFQWNPCMGKLVRTLNGQMVDVLLDVRKGSPTFGKAIMYDMPARHTDSSGEWIWAPPGLAHGNFFEEDSRIEYMCSGEYSPGCEAGISPLAPDIDWSLCEPSLKRRFDRLLHGSPLISGKDREACTVEQWAADTRSEHFIYGRV